MKKLNFSTTFSKMTTSFVLFGLLPLLCLSLLFFARYSKVLKENMIDAYVSKTSYTARNIGELLENADEVLGALYDYQSTDGQTLGDVLRDAELTQEQRQIGVRSVLREVLPKTSYISSLRMVDTNGEIYSIYYSQDKTLRADDDAHTVMGVYGEGDNLTDLRLFGTFLESEVCVNSDDYVFSMVRNYMDTSSIETTATKALATVFADINVEEIAKIVERAGADDGRCYVYLPDSSQYIYSVNETDYINGANPLLFCADLFVGESGYETIGSQWVFYEKIGDMNAYVVYLLDQSEFMGAFFQTRTVLALILCFSCAFLLVLYMAFSIRMSAPTRKLKEAMEEVEHGNLDVRVNLDTNDEMEYVADGFNKMAERLEEYINRVYVAQICQKDAELNALKMQIQPHYLYNTLDVIRMTALDQNDRKTARLLESLAKQLRYVMGGQSDRVHLKEELNSIREYFTITRVRYEGRITLMIDIEDEDQMLLVPKFILQPLVENAIRHGLRDKEGNGAVGIHVERRTVYLEIAVMDDGVGMPPEAVEHIREVLENHDLDAAKASERVGIGMKNVYDRIKLNCGPEYGFSLQSTLGVGTAVTFRLPIWEDENEA